MALKESAAQVAALITRNAWYLMDDDQRDELIRNVVMPRYMKESSDGTKLGPTWWAEQLGASYPTIQNRVYRLRAKASSGTAGKSLAEPSASQKGAVRGAKAAIRKHPGLAKKLVEDEQIADAIVADRESRVILAKAQQRRAEEVIAVSEAKEPALKQAREVSETLDTVNELRKFRRYLQNETSTVRGWDEWTDFTREEWTETVDTTIAALDSMRTPWVSAEDELAELLSREEDA